MKVWIDQDLCTGDGLCEEIAPDVFTLLDDGLAYVKEGDKIFAEAKGNPQGADGMAEFPDSQLDSVVESAEECPGECIYIEPLRTVADIPQTLHLGQPLYRAALTERDGRAVGRVQQPVRREPHRTVTMSKNRDPFRGSAPR